jgi:hypothetical protein
MNLLLWHKLNFRKTLYSSVEAIEALTAADKSAMFQLMQAYYSGMERDAFLADLHDKNEAIILRKHHQGEIVGFSTLKYFDLKNGGRKAIGVFSGDTIVHEE